MNKFTPITAEQIERFFDSRCTPEEAEQVTQYLQENPDVLQHYIQRDWKELSTEGPIPAGYRGDMFREITAQVHRKKVVPMRKIMMGAAAAIIVLVAGTWIWSARPAKQENPVVNTPANVAPPVIASVQRVRENKSNHNESVLLPDSSTVILYAKSTLRYPEPFDKDKRALQLEGTATFTVKKKERQPFILTTGPIETTVLGTEFNVTMEEEAITVKLYSGKVRLHANDSVSKKWKKDVVLTPGEQLFYADKGEEIVLSRFDEEPIVEQAEPVEEQELVFENEPLPQLLNKLAGCYHLNITYNKEQLSNRYFTGTVLTSDSITTILKVIANMNELTVIPNKRGFIIRKLIP